MNGVDRVEMEPESGLQQYKRALSRFATGVTVMTTLHSARKPAGMTVNSFSSVSLDPPLVLWSLALSSSMSAHFEQGKHFGVNVLARDQTALSRRFSSKGVDRFAGVPWSQGESGVPLLADALATFECVVEGRYPAGDHVILVGRVLRYREAEGEPLVYHSGAYWRTTLL